MIALATDTNFHLHWPSIERLTPGALGVEEDDVSWLVAITVIEELDDVEHNSRERKMRERASAEKKVILRAIETETTLETSCPVAYARGARDYAKYRANPAVNDERILADLMRYREDNPGIDIRVITGDGAMRLRARDRGFPTITPPADLRLPDVPTTSEKKLREAERRLAAIASAKPKLAVVLAGGGQGEATFSVSEPLTSADVEDIVEHAIRPAPSDTMDSWQQIMGYSENGTYDIELQQYKKDLASFIRSTDFVANRQIKLRFTVRNDGIAPAEKIDLILDMPPLAAASAAEHVALPAPYRPQRIRKPKAHMTTESLNKSIQALHEPLRKAEAELELKMKGPMVTVGHTIRVDYHLAALPQHEQKTLAPLFLSFDTEQQPTTIPIKYRLRTANVPGEQKGLMRLHLTWGPAKVDNMLSLLNDCQQEDDSDETPLW